MLCCVCVYLSWQLLSARSEIYQSTMTVQHDSDYAWHRLHQTDSCNVHLYLYPSRRLAGVKDRFLPLREDRGCFTEGHKTNPSSLDPHPTFFTTIVGNQG
jgi:hypothetical protein